MLTRPCPVPLNEWITLEVRRSNARLEGLVNGRSIFMHEDRQNPLTGNQFGLRVWKRSAQFRDLQLETSGKTQQIPFKSQTLVDTVSGAWISRAMALFPAL